MTQDQLERIRDWANQKLATGAERPRAWFQYMKLRDNLDAILKGMDATTEVTLPEESPQAAQR